MPHIIGAKSDSEIGLAKNNRVAFRCGTCKYFDHGKCQNPNPQLEGKVVGAYWCCNLYDHSGMEVVI